MIEMEKDIDRITKNSDTDIVIRLDDFGGRRGLTIREFVRSERYTGFTKAGTRVPAEQFENFRKAINSINVDDFLAEESSGQGDKKEAKGKAASGQKKSDKITEIEETEM